MSNNSIQSLSFVSLLAVSVKQTFDPLHVSSQLQLVSVGINQLEPNAREAFFHEDHMTRTMPDGHAR